MNNREAARVLAEMTATWPQKKLTDGETAIWRETLAPFPVDAGLMAVAELRTKHDWLPTHRQFVEAATDAARRQRSTRAIGPGDEPLPSICGLCGDTGWREVDVIGRSLDAVERCKCSKGKTLDTGLDEGKKHPERCNCHACRYGPVQARQLRIAPRGHALRRVVDPAAPADDPRMPREPADEPMF